MTKRLINKTALITGAGQIQEITSQYPQVVILFNYADIAHKIGIFDFSYDGALRSVNDNLQRLCIESFDAAVRSDLKNLGLLPADAPTAAVDSA